MKVMGNPLINMLKLFALLEGKEISSIGETESNVRSTILQHLVDDLMKSLKEI